MNEVRILKYPFKKTKSTTITILSFEITTCIVIPFTSVLIYINFYDDEENIHMKSCLLEKEDYEKWEFDSYLYNYVNEMMHLFF